MGVEEREGLVGGQGTGAEGERGTEGKGGGDVVGDGAAIQSESTTTEEDLMMIEQERIERA